MQPTPPPRGLCGSGFLPLTDAAPLIVARNSGFLPAMASGSSSQPRNRLGDHSRKDLYGELDAAHAPAPMLWSAQLGIGCAPCRVLTALVLNLHGNAHHAFAGALGPGVRDAASLRDAVRDRRQPRAADASASSFRFPPITSCFATGCEPPGIDPDRDVRIVVVPPAQDVPEPRGGTIDGYCAGEPWNSLAVREGAGWCPTWSRRAPAGPGSKKSSWSRAASPRRAPRNTPRFVAALADAAAWCDEPQNRERLADLLAGARYLNLPARVICRRHCSAASTAATGASSRAGLSTVPPRRSERAHARPGPRLQDALAPPV